MDLEHKKLVLQFAAFVRTIAKGRPNNAFFRTTIDSIVLTSKQKKETRTGPSRICSGGTKVLNKLNYRSSNAAVQEEIVRIANGHKVTFDPTRNHIEDLIGIVVRGKYYSPGSYSTKPRSRKSALSSLKQYIDQDDPDRRALVEYLDYMAEEPRAENHISINYECSEWPSCFHGFDGDRFKLSTEMALLLVSEGLLSHLSAQAMLEGKYKPTALETLKIFATTGGKFIADRSKIHQITPDSEAEYLEQSEVSIDDPILQRAISRFTYWMNIVTIHRSR